MTYIHNKFHICPNNTLAYMFMHESCLLPCRPCFNIMEFWTFDLNLHLSLAGTIFCFIFACLSYCLFTCFLVPLLAMSIMLICFMPRSYALCIFSLHCLFAGFLSLHLHVHTWSGTLRARAQSPRRKQKGHGYKHVDVSQAAMFNRFRGLAYPIWLCTL